MDKEGESPLRLHPAPVVYPSGLSMPTGARGQWTPAADTPAHAKAGQQHYWHGEGICTHLPCVCGVLVSVTDVLCWCAGCMRVRPCWSGLWCAGRRPKNPHQTELIQITAHHAAIQSHIIHILKHHGLEVTDHPTGVVWCMSGIVTCARAWSSVTETVLPTK